MIIISLLIFISNQFSTPFFNFQIFCAMRTQQELKYPIGQFTYGRSYTLDETRKNIKSIARLSKQIKKLLKKTQNNQLDATYRKGGWTIRQIINHIVDSHINAYVRMKLAVTENIPVIKPYEEKLWAETEDGKNGSVKSALKLLSALHRRWVSFMESLSEEELERLYYHPANQRRVSLTEAIALYSWHSRHHLAHIRLALENGNSPKTESKAAESVAEAPAKRGRPARKATATSAPAAEKSGSSKASPKAEGPKLTRAEILAKARAARKAKQTAEQPKAAAPAKAVKTAKKAAKSAAKAEGPKLTRAEILAKARAARKAKQAVEQPKAAAPAKAVKTAKKAAKAEGPKLTRAEILAKARAARQAKQATE
ncbi:MAG TPA: putative metal-dependent hydrolase, partial [Saprospiraceae bacterium]|nr:putative metal-dependent hydrolase [Saprospiraceae bacterium]